MSLRGRYEVPSGAAVRPPVRSDEPLKRVAIPICPPWRRQKSACCSGNGRPSLPTGWELAQSCCRAVPRPRPGVSLALDTTGSRATRFEERRIRSKPPSSLAIVGEVERNPSTPARGDPVAQRSDQPEADRLPASRAVPVRCVDVASEVGRSNRLVGGVAARWQGPSSAALGGCDHQSRRTSIRRRQRGPWPGTGHNRRGEAARRLPRAVVLRENRWCLAP